MQASFFILIVSRIEWFNIGKVLNFKKYKESGVCGFVKANF